MSRLSHAENHREYVVTTSSNGDVKSHVWDSSAPLALGHPFRWVIERTESGVRIRNVSLERFEIEEGAVREIPSDEILKGTDVVLPKARKDSSPEITLRIREARSFDAPFSGTSTEDSSANGELQIYECAGNWIRRSYTLTESFTGIFQGKPAFDLIRSGKDVAIKARSEDIFINADGLAANKSKTITQDQLGSTTISKGGLKWHFAFVEAQKVAETLEGKALDTETLWFQKAMKICAGTFVALSLLMFILPKPEQTPEEKEELIPEQYVKLVMNNSAPPASEESGGGATNAPVPQKAAETKVAQAFRAKALQSAVSGLLKGGMTTLLAQSDLVNSNTASAKMFNSSKIALNSDSSAKTADIGNRNTKVTTLGGGSKGGVGYGKGKRAGVQGQGQGFVSFDDAQGVVEEGLSKEQVGEVIHKHMSEVRYCYESAILRTASIEGKLSIAFTISPSGAVKSAKVNSSTVPDPRLDDCVLRRLMSWKFPKPKGGGSVSVSYPFIFKTLGR